jgi:hypothetical protein
MYKYYINVGMIYMSRLTKKEKLKRYHAIFNQIYSNPRVYVHEISRNLKFARNTVSGYLEYMYDSLILFGPELRLKYYSGLKQYVYLAKFNDPYAAFDELQRDPKITFCTLSLGDYNIIFMCGEEYDASHIKGFENVLFKGNRGDIITPEVPHVSWKSAFEKMIEQASAFEPDGTKQTRFEVHPPPDWDEEEWKLFSEYQFDFRKKVTPVLRKHLISSDKFYQWLKTLHEHTTVLTRFYPDGYENYTHFMFHLITDYVNPVISLLSNLPTSTICTHVDDGLIVWLAIKSDMTFTDLSAVIHRMKSSGMINDFQQAIGVLYYVGAEEGYAKLR